MFKSIAKYFKKRRLMNKYKLTQEKMKKDIWVTRFYGDDIEGRRWYSHQRMCELRCYNRLKAL